MELWKSFPSIVLFLSEESPIKGPAEIITVQHTSDTFEANQISMYVFLFIFYLFCVLLCFQLKNFKATDSQLTLV